MQFVQVASLGATQVFVTGDLNHDGKPDLVLISDSPDGNGNAYVQLGNGDGTFGPPTTYPIAPVAVFSAGQAKLADLRGTGNLDLIAPSVDWNNIFVLLGKGNGTLLPSVSYPTSFFQTNEVIAGDFNGDKKLDLGLVEWKLEHGGGAGLVEVFLGKGDGTFGTSISTSPIPASSAGPIVSGDFNRDGALDVAVAMADSVEVLLGNGDGTFQPAVAYTPGGAGSGVRGLVAADFNSDGILDLATTNRAQVNVFLGKGDGTFEIPTTVPVPVLTGPEGIAAADMNSDGKIDLAIVFDGLTGSDSSSSGFGVLLGNGDGTFSPGATVPVLNTNFFIAVADFNNSGHPGVALNTNSSVLVFLQGPLPDFSLGVTSETSITVTPGQVANYSVAVVPINGFSQSVTLSCSGQPAESTCTVTPSSVAPGSTAEVTVVTQPASMGLTQPVGGLSESVPFGFSGAFSGTLGLVLLMGMTRSRRALRPQLLYGLTFVCLLSLGVTMSACGGDRSRGGGTQPGTYTLTVTGSYTTTLTHNAKLTLVVQ